MVPIVRFERVTIERPIANSCAAERKRAGAERTSRRTETENVQSSSAAAQRAEGRRWPM